MIKIRELTDPNSCMSRAFDDERTFVLLERDETAPATIREWARLRIKCGKNQRHDEQILEALECAALMELEFIRSLRAKRAVRAVKPEPAT